MLNQDEKVAKLLNRFQKSKAESQKWSALLSEVYDYVVPNRNSFNSAQPGQNKTTQVFDSTPLIATAKYTSRLQNLLVRPWTNWFNLHAGTDIPDDEKQKVDKYLQKVTDIIMTEINHSNFSTQISEAFTDLAVSTGVIMVNEDTNPNSDADIIFKTIPLSQISLESASDGEVKTVFREFTLPINQIIPTWKKAKFTEEMNDTLEKDPTSPTQIIEATIYRENDFKYDFTVMTKSGDILLSEVIDESPFVVFRETVAPGETFGRGRLMTLLGDIKTLNKAVELGLKSASLAISGVFTAVDDGILNVKNIRLTPGAIIPVGTNSTTNPALAPLQSPSDFRIEQMLVQEIRQRINDHMLVEPFGNINDTSVRSATEMNIRQNDFIQTSVASFSRLQTELLSKIVNKVIHVLKKRGKIPNLTINSKELNIKYSSPIAKIEGIEEINSLNQFMEAMQAVPPEIVEISLDYNKVPVYVANAVGLDKELLRTKDEQKKLVEKQHEIQAAQQQQAIQQQQQLDQQQNPATAPEPAPEQLADPPQPPAQAMQQPSPVKADDLDLNK